MITDFLRSERYFALFSLSLCPLGIKWRDALQLSPFLDSMLRRLERVSYNLCTCQDNETKKFHAFSY